MKKPLMLPVLIILFLCGQFAFADPGGVWTGNGKEGTNSLRQTNPWQRSGSDETAWTAVWGDYTGGSLWPGWQDIQNDTGPIATDPIGELESLRNEDPQPWTGGWPGYTAGSLWPGWQDIPSGTNPIAFDLTGDIENLRNQGPQADAGPDQTVDEGTTVTLDGTNSSDSDDGIASYQWTQTSGTSVTIDNDTAAQATFVAPDSGPPNEMLTFELEVNDNSGVSDTDSVTVYVSHEADGDVAPFGARDGIVNVGDSLVAMRFALGLLTPTQEDMYHGDTAPLDDQGEPVPDGEITVGDALIILQKALGMTQSN